MKKLITVLIGLVLLQGCVATAPVSIAWRSNTSQQFAATEGKNDKAADTNSVNADRTTETQAAVATGAGRATTSDNQNEEAK